jgi:phosphatidylglycerol:prolipoprotein diacylglycerol transferase
MYPNSPMPAFLIGWAIAAALGGGSAIWLMLRAGLQPSQVVVAILVFATTLILGSKLLYLIEIWPSWISDRQAAMAALLSPQLRIPGGFVLALVVGPSRFIGVRRLWFADTIVPAAGLLIVGIRIGCFLAGDCFGTPSSLPWAVSFPATYPLTEVYAWQFTHGLIGLGAPATVPVHPLQLYFALAGLGLFVGLSAYRPHVRYDGELLLLFWLGFLWSTWSLELLRAEPHDLTRRLVLAGALFVTGLAAVVEWRLRLKTPGATVRTDPRDHA